MDIIEKLKSNFLSFNYKDYIKIFISIKAQDEPILLSFINLNYIDIVKRHFKNFFIEKNNHLYLSEDYNTPHLISEAFTFFAFELERLEGIKIRGEQILLQSEDTKYSLGYVDRSLIHIFGLKASGVHLNAYVEKLDENGNLSKFLWVAKRSVNKLHDPNKLDNIVAGAISLGFSPLETLNKEAHEEAGIPSNLLLKQRDITNKNPKNQGAILSKIITYKSMQYDGLRDDIVYIYSLKLPENFTPKAFDGEVEEFFLMSIPEVLDILINDFSVFKYNSALVILYFLYSQGYIQNKELSDFLNNLFLKLEI